MTQTNRPLFKFAHLKHTLLVTALGLAASPAWSQEGEGGGGGGATLTAEQYVTTINGIAYLQIELLRLTQLWKSRKMESTIEISSSIDDRDRLKAGLDGQTGLAGAAGDSPWSAWAAASRNNATYSFQPLASTSRSNDVMAGVGYRLGGGSEVGVNLGSDTTDVNSGATGRTLNYRGYNVLPYFFVPLAPQWTLDGTLGFGGATVRANTGGNVTGQTRESRVFGAVGVNYFTSAGNWRLVGTGGLQSYSTRLQQFTLSNATVVAATNSNLTQLTIGGQARYGSGQFVPYVGIDYSHDISRSALVPVAGQTPSSARGTFSAQAGFSFRPSKQVSLNLQLMADRRTQLRNNGVMAMLNVRF